MAYQNSNDPGDFLNRDTTGQLRGISIVLVIVFHLLASMRSTPPASYSTFLGEIGVSTFIALSGFGLIQSYQINGLDQFFKKRLSKMLIPYMLVAIVLIVIDTLIKGIVYNWLTIVLTIIGLNFNPVVDPTSWFISYIILWYVVFYLIWCLPVSTLWRMLLLFGYSLIFFGKISSFFNIYYGAVLYLFEFPIGVLLGLYYRKLRTIQPGRLLIILALSAVACFLSGCIFVNKVAAYGGNYNLGCYLYSSAACLVLTIGIITLFGIFALLQCRSQILLYLGSISYQLYLIEYVFIGKYNILKAIPYHWLAIGIYVITVFVLARSLKMITSRPEWFVFNFGRVGQCCKDYQRKNYQRNEAIR